MKLRRSATQLSIRAPAPTEPDPEQSPDLPFEIAQQALERQLASVDAVDTKTASVFASGGGIFALLAAVVALRSERFHDAWVLTWFAVSFAAYVLIAGLALRSTQARVWRSGAKAGEVVADFRKGTTEIAAKWKATRALIASIEENDAEFKKKVARLSWCVRLLGIETISVVLGLVFVAR